MLKAESRDWGKSDKLESFSLMFKSWRAHPKAIPHQQFWGFCLLSIARTRNTLEMDPILARIDCSQACFRSSFL